MLLGGQGVSKAIEASADKRVCDKRAALTLLDYVPDSRLLRSRWETGIGSTSQPEKRNGGCYLPRAPTFDVPAVKTR
jgi:hypothetical protein